MLYMYTFFLNKKLGLYCLYYNTIYFQKYETKENSIFDCTDLHNMSVV